MAWRGSCHRLVPFNIATLNIQHSTFAFPGGAAMPIARSGVLWRRIFFVLLIAATAIFIWYIRREFPHGGSRWGLRTASSDSCSFSCWRFSASASAGIARRSAPRAVAAVAHLPRHPRAGHPHLPHGRTIQRQGRRHDADPRGHRRRQRHLRRDSLRHRAAAADRGGERI